MFEREIRALKMTSVITVMGVGQVSTQQWLLTQIDELTNTKWPTEYADVGSNPHHDYVLNTTLLKQIIYFLTIVTDRILLSDLNRLNLANPGRITLSTTRLWGMARTRYWIGDSNR